MQLVPIPSHKIVYKNRTLDLSTPHIMGILNVTPDSFSDGGKFNNLDNALYHTEQMIANGATIIDVGGESTRPNAPVVSEQQELDRTVNIVQAISQRFGEQVWISVDTSSPTVITECSRVGAGIWNDVRSLRRPNAIATASTLEIPVMLMHMRGEPDTMNNLVDYQDTIQDVLNEIQQLMDNAIAGGVKKENIILDVGFGFAKNTQQNLAWLQQFHQLHQFNRPIMVALSRKRFIGDILNQANLPSAVDNRDVASMVAGLLAVQQGACIIRTHDVATVKAGLAVWQATQ